MYARFTLCCPCIRYFEKKMKENEWGIRQKKTKLRKNIMINIAHRSVRWCSCNTRIEEHGTRQSYWPILFSNELFFSRFSSFRIFSAYFVTFILVILKCFTFCFYRWTSLCFVNHRYVAAYRAILLKIMINDFEQ